MRKQEVYVEVAIDLRDDTTEIYKCCEAPSINPDWITLFPMDDPTARKYIPRETVAGIEYRYKQHGKRR